MTTAAKHDDSKAKHEDAKAEEAHKPAGQDITHQVESAMEKASSHDNVAKQGSGALSKKALPLWGPVIMELLKQFGLPLLQTQLPILRAKVEAWDAKGFMKLVKAQLLAAIDAMADLAPVTVDGKLEGTNFLDHN